MHVEWEWVEVTLNIHFCDNVFNSEVKLIISHLAKSQILRSINILRSGVGVGC